MALEERWPMSAEARAAAIERLEQVVRDPLARPRAFDRAVKTLAALGRLNLASVDVALRATQQEELEERITELEQKAGIKP
jgi:hypothetical protein